ncbi:MAG: NAD-dependent epimerase/dehydratase family protein [Chloroflexi bacterium]|nr:NAD-dependent epimerase/dehydratase family protein [Chloroflexota bacterium]
MQAFVTGAAGFVGSHITERLLREGWEVVGVDAFTDYYARAQKEANLQSVLEHPSFRFLEADLLDLDLSALLSGVDVVFHQAAQAGVRASWGQSFEVYTRLNVLATQRLLEAAKDASLQKFVYASSSSVYGDAETFPTPETARPQPVSPYGVTKLAAEHLCYLYWRNYGVPTVSLRYFTVYGPRQRPDMAFHIFIRALLCDQPISVFGDGRQTRDFTFIDDAVAANLLAATRGPAGSVFNIGGGSRVSLLEVLATLMTLTGREAPVRFREAQRGDARHTAADITQALAVLGYRPQVPLEEGLAREVAWLREFLAQGEGSGGGH